MRRLMFPGSLVKTSFLTSGDLAAFHLLGKTQKKACINVGMYPM
jgi:hypothetical protein